MRKPVLCLCKQQRRRSSEISSLYLASLAAQAGMCYLVANPEDRFSRDKAQLRNAYCIETSNEMFI